MHAAKLFIGVLFAIFAFSATCTAADADQIAASLSAYVQAKTHAASYAAAVKEQYLEEKNAYEKAHDNLTAADLAALKKRIAAYLNVKLAYQQAAADFEGWRAVMELAVINDAKIPVNDVYYTGIGAKALASHAIFAKAADDYVRNPLLTMHQADAPSGPPGHLGGPKSLPVDTAVLLFKDIIFPAVDKLLAIRDKNIALKNHKRETLLDWLNKHAAWEEWDRPAPDHTPKPAQNPPAGTPPAPNP